MTLTLATEGWMGANATWNTYECDRCGESLHTTDDQPEPVRCPFCEEARR